jgi:biotin carboxyl carrier protein
VIYDIEIEGREVSVSIREAKDGGWWIAVDGSAEVHWEGQRLGAAEWLLREGGVGRAVGVYVEGDHATVQVGGYGLTATVTDPRRKGFGDSDGAGEGTVITPMPGVIVRIPVTEQQQVSIGDVLVVVEAMKMENEYRSAVDGVVAAIHVTAGQSVEANAILITVDPA